MGVQPISKDFTSVLNPCRKRYRPSLVREVRIELTMLVPKTSRLPLAYTHIIGTRGQIRTDTAMLLRHLPPAVGLLWHMATPTGLEPVTSGVTGRHSNQLNYEAISGDAYGIRTHEPAAVKGQCVKPIFTNAPHLKSGTTHFE